LVNAISGRLAELGDGAAGIAAGTLLVTGSERERVPERDDAGARREAS
jgi:hypothetical protein